MELKSRLRLLASITSPITKRLYREIVTSSVKLLCLMTPLVDLHASANDMTLPKASFSAEMVAEDQGEFRLMVIDYSPWGIRLTDDQLFPSSPGYYSSRFESNTHLLVRPDSKTYAELVGDQQDIDSTIGGVLSSSPCSGSDVVGRLYISNENLSGRSVQKWRCQYNGAISYELYSTELQVVIKEDFLGGGTTYLKRIKIRQYEPEFFELPEHYKQVSLEEVFTGSAPLKPYM